MPAYATKAHELLDRLALTKVKDGSGGRYPCGEPGPAQGYRYWMTFTEGRFKFGIQATPKKPLNPMVLSKLKARQFLTTPAETEAFVCLPETIGEAMQQAKVVMTQLRRELKS